MYIRKYKEEDCLEVMELFYQTVHTINARDYTKEQLDVWASRDRDIIEMNKSLLEHDSIVVIDNNTIVGFGDIDHTGYLDWLFVHKDYQGMGIGTMICDELEHRCLNQTITTHASLTAKLFFINRGYHVVKKQEVYRQGVMLENYVMEKHLDIQ